jgi:hypothetical protein
LKNKVTSIFILLVLITGKLFAQVNDAGLWASVTAEKKITSQLKISLEEQFRLHENYSQPNIFFSELDLDYRLLKNLSVGIGYRFIQSHEPDNNYSFYHRLILDLTYRIKVNRFKVDLRPRYEREYRKIFSSENGKMGRERVRAKATFKYDFYSRIKPYLATELFMRNKNSGFLINQYRLEAGINYEFSKKTTANLFYLTNREVNQKNPTVDYITGLGITFKL